MTTFQARGPGAMGSPNIIAAGALARPTLSAEATSLLRRLACMPPGWSRAELSALLEAEGLVGFDAAFEVEARFGGLTFEKSAFKLGIFATIRDAMKRVLER